MGHYHGLPTTNRLLIDAELMDVSGGRVQLQLDTAAKMPELFPVRPGFISSQPWAGSMAFSSGPNGTTIHSHTTIKVGAMQNQMQVFIAGVFRSALTIFGHNGCS
jgi:hypothetical protein